MEGKKNLKILKKPQKCLLSNTHFHFSASHLFKIAFKTAAIGGSSKTVEKNRLRDKIWEWPGDEASALEERNVSAAA